MPGDVPISAVCPDPGGEPHSRRALLWGDAALATVVCVGLLFANTRGDVRQVEGAEWFLRTAATVLAAAAIVVRRLDVRWALPMATAGAAVVSGSGGAPVVALCMALAAYTAASSSEYVLWWAPPAAASTVIAGATAVGRLHGWVAAVIASMAVVCVGWFAGQATRERRRRLWSAAEQGIARERQHAADLRQAAVDERLVIARELHDIVAHSMSVIAVRAGVARVVMDDDPVEVKEALGIIETTTRQALHEMRLLVEVLRQEDPDGPALAPAPGLGDIPALADQIRRAGVEVDVDVRGQMRPLPPGVDLSAYRIAQEALTNVVRHAGPTTATLRIEYRADDVLIDVVDAGPRVAGRVPTEHRPGAGHGLIGMGERVALFDGRLRTGRRGAGFEVSALLRTDAATS